MTTEARVKILEIVTRIRLSTISPFLPLTIGSSASESARAENSIASNVDLFTVASKLDNYRSSDIKTDY